MSGVKCPRCDASDNDGYMIAQHVCRDCGYDGLVVSPRAEAPQQEPTCTKCGKVKPLNIHGYCSDCATGTCPRCAPQQETREALLWVIHRAIYGEIENIGEWLAHGLPTLDAVQRSHDIRDAILSQFSVAPRKENQ
jgi:hypothetical protein